MLKHILLFLSLKTCVLSIANAQAKTTVEKVVITSTENNTGVLTNEWKYAFVKEKVLVTIKIIATERIKLVDVICIPYLNSIKA